FNSPSSSQAGTVSSQGQLQYLSTADMLQIEAQGQWVREHYEQGSQHKYDTVAGKLAVIGAILAQNPVDITNVKKIQSLDIAFGDALVQETGVQWATLENGNIRTPVLIMADTATTIFPLSMISKVIESRKAVDIQQIFRDAVQTINQRIGKHA